MNTHRKIYLLVFFVLSTCSLFAQLKLIEKVTGQGDKTVIPYAKYQLANGLTLLIHEDHSDPMVYVNVTYHVGSAREEQGKSGYAHFFEHMMFEGSEHIPPGMHFKIVTDAGGIDNGTTTRDKTDYWELLPSNQLETALWLESDRMGFFLDSISQKKFEIQRLTVKNERSQRFDNHVLGLVSEKIGEAFYPPEHPYSWQTIGYPDDLDRATVDDLKKFFMRWYGPNNATLTVAGDVTPEEVVKLVDKYFSPIPAGPEVKVQQLPPVTFENNRFVSYRDKIGLPQVTFTFPTVPAFHPDEAPLDILADILGEGKSSVFYQYFIASDDAEALSVQHPCYELAGEFKIVVFAKRVKHFDKMLNDAFEVFEKKGVSAYDLQKFITQYEVKKLDEMESIKDKGGLLAFYQTLTGNPNYIAKDFERYKNVTPEDIMRVYNKYLKGKPSLVFSVKPYNADELVRKDNYEVPKRSIKKVSSDANQNFTYKKTQETFDRSVRPTSPPAPVVKVPDFWKTNLTNGLKIIGSYSDEQPCVSMQISIQAGHRYEDKKQKGISQLLTDILKGSTAQSSAGKIDWQLNSMGSNISIWSTDEEITFYITSLTRNFDSTLAILKEIILHPKFSRKEFEQVKASKMEYLTSGSYNPNTIDLEMIKRLIHGENHILGGSVHGTAETVNKISVKDVQEYYETRCLPSLSSVVFVGNMKQEEVMKKLDFLNNWKDNKYELYQPEQAPPVNKTVIYFFSRYNATQSQIRVGFMGLPYDATGDYYKSSIATYALASPFSSRVNLNLREEHGYCYHATSCFYGNKYEGPYVIEADVRGNATDSALAELMKEIKNYADKGITSDELTFTKNSMAQSEAMKYETPYQKISFLKRILDFNLPQDFTSKQNELLKNISLEEVNSIAKKSLPYKNMIILIIGNRESAYSKLKYLPYELYEINSKGVIINSN